MQFGDDWYRGPMPGLGEEFVRLLRYDFFSGGKCGLSSPPVLITGVCQVINGVEIRSQVVADGWFEIAGHGQIQDEQGALVSAWCDMPAVSFQSDNWLVGTRGTDHDVGLDKPFVEMIPGDRGAMPFFGEKPGTREVAVGDLEVLRPRIDQISERFLGHFSSPNDQDHLVVETFEDAAGEVCDGNTRYADTMPVQGSLACDASRRAESRLKKLVSEGSRAANSTCQVVGFFYLCEYLRFPDDHAVEAGGNTEQVAYHVFIFQRNQGGLQLIDGYLMEMSKMRSQRFRAGREVLSFDRSVEFHAITR